MMPRGAKWDVSGGVPLPWMFIPGTVIRTHLSTTQWVARVYLPRRGRSHLVVLGCWNVLVPLIR